MRTRILMVALAMSLASPVAAETPKKKASPAVEPVEASYKAEGVEKADVAKRLARVLAGHPGIRSARADKEKGRFVVRFDPTQTDAEAIRLKLAGVVPGVTLDAPPAAAASPAPATPVFGEHEHGGGCGGCPFHNAEGGGCGKH